MSEGLHATLALADVDGETCEAIAFSARCALRWRSTSGLVRLRIRPHPHRYQGCESVQLVVGAFGQSRTRSLSGSACYRPYAKPWEADEPQDLSHDPCCSRMAFGSRMTWQPGNYALASHSSLKGFPLPCDITAAMYDDENQYALGL